MSRYIDADVLIDKLMNAIECGRRVDMPTQELEAVLSDVRNAPSIDIVRCKECKWAKANGTYQWCGRLDSTARITADDFCSYGEPSSSEKPNNCEDWQDWKDRMWAEAIVTEPQTESEGE